MGFDLYCWTLRRRTDITADALATPSGNFFSWSGGLVAALRGFQCRSILAWRQLRGGAAPVQGDFTTLYSERDAGDGPYICAFSRKILRLSAHHAVALGFAISHLPSALCLSTGITLPGFLRAAI